jgi:hypothetical protein
VPSGGKYSKTSLNEHLPTLNNEDFFGPFSKENFYIMNTCATKYTHVYARGNGQTSYFRSTEVPKSTEKCKEVPRKTAFHPLSFTQKQNKSVLRLGIPKNYENFCSHTQNIFVMF